MIFALSAWVVVAALGGDFDPEVHTPLILWRFDVCLIKESEGNSNAPAATKASISANASVPSKSVIDPTPSFFSVFGGTYTVEPANVTLVEDGQIADVAGARVRIRANSQFEVTGDVERPLENSSVVYDMERARHLVTRYGEKAENYSQRNRGVSASDSGDTRWNPIDRICEDITLGAVGQDGGDAILVEELRFGQRLGEAPAPAPGESHLYQLISERVVTASFWIRPSQTAVIRLPMRERDRATPVVFVTAKLAPTSHTSESSTNDERVTSAQFEPRAYRSKPAIWPPESP